MERKCCPQIVSKPFLPKTYLPSDCVFKFPLPNIKKGSKLWSVWSRIQKDSNTDLGRGGKVILKMVQRRVSGPRSAYPKKRKNSNLHSAGYAKHRMKMRSFKFLWIIALVYCIALYALGWTILTGYYFTKGMEQSIFFMYVIIRYLVQQCMIR